MKSIWMGLLLIVVSASGGCQILITSNGSVSFFSETPMENISAVNSTVSTLINTKTDSVFVRMKNTSFEFKNALMKEHFNENYMESTKFPFDSFRGKINEDINYSQIGNYQVTATGKMTIHGVTKVVIVAGALSVTDKGVHLDANTVVRTADFNIEIPKLVFTKIAEEIKIKMTADYKIKN